MTAKLRSVHVPLPGRAYDVRIGPGLVADAGAQIAPLLARPKLAIVTDANVAALHLKTLEQSLDAKGISHKTLILPAGEATKSWARLEETVEWLLAQKIERRDVVVAFGGGVIGDLVGFAAAILRRGVAFVQIPTSLLAQVDSSVGGKTGINSPSGTVDLGQKTVRLGARRASIRPAARTLSGRFTSPHWYWPIPRC